MKKSLIALTVAGMAAHSAYAVDLDAKTPTSSVNFAAELTITGTGIEVTSTETVITKTGFTITDAAPRFFRYELDNGATFVGNPTLAIAPGAGSVGTAAVTQSSGGAGQSFVLFEVSASPAGTLTNDSVATLTLAAPGDNLGLAGGTNVTYFMYESGVDGGSGQLATNGPGPLAGFLPATAIGTATATQTSSAALPVPVEATKLIDVAQDSTVFNGVSTSNTVTSLGSGYFTDSGYVGTGTVFDADGNTASYGTAPGAVIKGATLMVAGDLSAAKSVYVAAGATTCTGAPAVACTINDDDDEATCNIGATSWGTQGLDAGGLFISSVVNVCLEVTGTDIINEGSYTGTYTPTVNTGFTLAPVMFDLATLGNTGSTQILNLTLTPTTEMGVYKNYFRITNTGTNEGRVFIRLINDLGESSATIDMEDVYDDGVNTIVGGGSSRQFDIDAVYAEVVEQDPTFSVGDAPRRKLRTVITGEFGGINVQTYTVSTDETTFSTF